MRQSFAYLLENSVRGFPVRLQNSARFGRCLVAAKDIQAGETVLEEQPWYSSDISDQPDVAERLNYKYVKDFESSSSDFKAASNFFGQVLLKRHPMLSNLVDDDVKSAQEWPEFELGHSQPIWNDCKDSDSLRHIFVHLQEEFELKEDNFWSKKIFVDLTAKYLSNCYQIHDTPFTELYIGKSMFNHACGSNCHIWPDSGNVFAIVNIKEGEQLFLNYGSDNLQNHSIDCFRDEKCMCHSGADIPRDMNQLRQIHTLNKIRRDSFKAAGVRVVQGEDQLWGTLEKHPQKDKFFEIFGRIFPSDLDWEEYGKLTEKDIEETLKNLGPEKFLESKIGKMAKIKPVAMKNYLELIGVDAEATARKMKK